VKTSVAAVEDAQQKGKRGMKLRLPTKIGGKTSLGPK
jgi:hypothetical protein